MILLRRMRRWRFDCYEDDDWVGHSIGFTLVGLFSFSLQHNEHHCCDLDVFKIASRLFVRQVTGVLPCLPESIRYRFNKSIEVPSGLIDTIESRCIMSMAYAQKYTQLMIQTRVQTARLWVRFGTTE